MLAPEVTHTNAWPSAAFVAIHLLQPATAKAPAGSNTERVSSKTSLIAAHISSLLTSTISSTQCCAIRKHSSPTCLTAAPSANSPTSSSVTRFPSRRLCVIAAASTVSTPMSLVSGHTFFKKAPTPAISPPPPTQQKTTSGWLVCRAISSPTVPCPAMMKGSSNGGITTRFSCSAIRRHSSLAWSKSLPNRIGSAPRLRTLSTFIWGVNVGMTIEAEMSNFCAARATPCAWLPALHATTPRDFSSAVKWYILL
mmetsp:Transcript_48794/g.95710  ORF Transcript_48794/g.95710 Transcript_48794/m.95710 type:complete len:253 (-) Transcript_48794:259-1017(-)